jgi:hypothetical protein
MSKVHTWVAGNIIVMYCKFGGSSRMTGIVNAYNIIQNKMGFWMRKGRYMKKL